MKIAHKLQVDLITKHIVKHIEGDWPQTLDEWDALCQPLAFWHSEGHQPKEELPEPIATIIFARTFDVPKVLPVAFYELSRRRYRHDWDVEHLRNFEKGGRRVAARWSLLSKEDHIALGRLREYIQDFVYSDKFLSDSDFMYVLNQNCQNWERDKNILKKLRTSLRNSFNAGGDILRVLQSICSTSSSRGLASHEKSTWTTEMWFCDHCDGSVSNRARQWRAVIWGGK